MDEEIQAEAWHVTCSTVCIVLGCVNVCQEIHLFLSCELLHWKTIQSHSFLCLTSRISLSPLVGMFPLSAEEPESNRKLHHLLSVVTDALVWVIAKSGIPSQQQTTRLANLLMLLSHVRHAR